VCDDIEVTGSDTGAWTRQMRDAASALGKAGRCARGEGLDTVNHVQGGDRVQKIQVNGENKTGFDGVGHGIKELLLKHGHP